MPLRDHFHSPVNDRHSWDELHGLWPGIMVVQLAQKLPREFVAAPKIHLGGSVEIDVATFEEAGGGRDDPHGNGTFNGTATATLTDTEPTVSVETEMVDVDEYEVRVFDLTRARRLVAAVELVSPSNKDRPETRRALVTKCAALLQEGVSVTIVDVVTSRLANLYAELLAAYDRRDPTVAAPPSATYAVTCRGRMAKEKWVLDGWHRPLAVGQPLPTLPLWLTPTFAIWLDLEASYEETCRVLRIG
jgi:hypothetical protein